MIVKRLESISRISFPGFLTSELVRPTTLQTTLCFPGRHSRGIGRLISKRTLNLLSIRQYRAIRFPCRTDVQIQEIYGRAELHRRLEIAGDVVQRLRYRF